MSLWDKKWLPAAVGLAAIALTLILWRSLLNQQTAEIQRSIASTTSSTASLIETEINAVVLGLKRAAKRWELRNGTPQNEWQADARNYIQDTPGLQSMEWIDTELQSRWLTTVLPPARMELHLDLQQNLGTQKWQIQGGQNRPPLPPRSVLVVPASLYVNERSHFHIAIPLMRRVPAEYPLRSRWDGFLVSTFDAQAFLSSAVAEVPPLYNIAVLSDGIVLYQRYPSDNPVAPTAGDSSTISVSPLDSTWQVRVWLSPLASRDPMPQRFARGVLGTGLMMTILLVLISYLAQAMRDRAHQLETTNQQLAAEAEKQQRLTLALSESEAQYRDLFENSNDLILSVDLDGQFLYVNRAWKETLGYNDAELAMRTLFDLAVPNCSGRCDNLRQCLTLGQPMDKLEVALMSKDQQQIWLEGSLNFRFINQQPVSMRCIFRNISDRHQAEAARKRNEEEIVRLSHALEVAVVGISQLNAQGHYVMVKPAYARLLGYSPEEMLGLHWHDTIHPEDRDLAIAAYQKMLMHEKAELEVRAVRQDQSVFEQKIVLVKAYDESGRFNGHYGFMKDVSDRREVERLKEQFISIVSHELRTPLTSISVALDLLAGGVLQNQPQEAQRMLTIAANNTDRLVRLINDILDVERVRSGKVAMTKQTCTVADLFTQSIETVQEMAERSGITLAVSSLPTRLWADPDRIVQVLVNLLSNAIKFSPPGSTIELRAELQPLQPANPAPHSGTAHPVLLLSVRDQGRGIPADKLETIFEPFQQVDASDSRQKGGTGLGLAICRSILEQHAGRIWVDSELGQGSTFWVQLPALWEVEQPAVGAIAPTASAALSDAPLVLICDDDSSVRTVVQTLLEQQGYRVLTADSGKAAVELSTTTHPQVILLNLTMPGMDGWETLATLKRQPETESIPVVILSGLLPDATQPEYPEVSGWVVKPPNRQVLLHTLSQAVGKPAHSIRVLVVEDDLDLAQVLITVCTRNHLETFHARSGAEAIRLSQEVAPDLLVLDLGLPQGDGFAVVDWLRHHNHLSRVPLVVYTARDLGAEERDRLTLQDPTLFLTKGRIPPQEFEQRVISLLNRITVHPPPKHSA